MAANFRSRMLHHGKISRVFSVFSPPKVVNQRLWWPRVGAKREKGKTRKRVNRSWEAWPRKEKKRARSAKVGGLLLFFSFSSPFFIISSPRPPSFFARLLSSKNPFYAAMDSRWSRLIDILRATIPDFISDLLSHRNEKSSAWTPRTEGEREIFRRNIVEHRHVWSRISNIFIWSLKFWIFLWNR